MGFLDQDVSDKVSLAVPQLYRRGIERKEWTQTKFWLYMIDGLYQSLIAFFFTYLNFQPATFLSEGGKGINDYKRTGAFIANPIVVIVNMYFLLNTYRWDWFFVLITTISALLIFLWTGAYTSFTAGFTFYGAAAEVYGTLSFWCNFFLTIIVCLLPRFAAKTFQKMYMPRDIDIVREQVKQGKFDYLNDIAPDNVSPAPEKLMDSASSTDDTKPSKQGAQQMQQSKNDDTRPIYPPSVAATATTHGTRTGNGSDGTEYTHHRDDSLDRQFPYVGGRTEHNLNTNNLTTPLSPTITTSDMDGPSPQTPTYGTPTYERPRPSFERVRSSMDRVRPSFEASRDFTSAAYLTRVESSHSAQMQAPTGGRGRMQDITGELKGSGQV